MLTLTVFATGSSGNCYALENGKGEALLLDAGVRASRILSMQGGARALTNAVGCIVTHEHGDHADGAAALGKYGIPIYASEGTVNKIGKAGTGRGLHPVPAGKVFRVGSYRVMPFEVTHDSAEPFGYVIQTEGETTVYLTDSGYIPNVFRSVNHWIIECNYCDRILEARRWEMGRFRYDRVRVFHMGLNDLVRVLLGSVNDRTDSIVLIHLSDGNSDEREILDTVRWLCPADVNIAHAGDVIRMGVM